MLRITIELWPFGFETNKKTLSIMNIWNDGTGTKTSGNYKYKILKTRSKTQSWRSGFVNNFRRKQMNAWDLLFLVLLDAVGDRNIKNKE